MREEDQKQGDCKICGNTIGNRFHTAYEMMFGMRDQFTYLECINCGTLQITKIPDLTKYYPKDYHSYQFEASREHSPQLSFKERLVQRVALNCYFNRRNLLGRSIVEHNPRVSEQIPSYIKETKCSLRISDRSSVLDVGCGIGQKLLELHFCGLNNLTGVDPFISSSFMYSDEVRVLKADISALKQQYDLVMMHHALEHVPNPQETLQAINRVLKKGRYAIIRMPVVSYAWERYGVNWVQLDPPRHLFLFTANGFTAMAEDFGFVVDEVFYDSTAFQYWGSEQYIKDIPLTDERSFGSHPENSLFTPEQIEAFEVQAAELNRQEKGDQAAFYLRKVSDKYSVYEPSQQPLNKGKLSFPWRPFFSRKEKVYIGKVDQNCGVSVCMPTYNGSRYLREAIDSALSQTHTNIELLIVDDASTDDTMSIAQEYACHDSRVRIYRNLRRLGLVGNWNRCLDLAKGEWIKFLFQDDYLHPTCVEQMLESSRQSGAILVACDRDIAFEAEVSEEFRQGFLRSVAEHNLAQIFPNPPMAINSTEFARYVTLYPVTNCIGEPTAVMFHRSAIRRVGYFISDLVQNPDWEYWMRLAVNTGLCYLPDKLATFRLHGRRTSLLNRSENEFRRIVIDPLIIYHELVYNPLYAAVRRIAKHTLPRTDLKRSLFAQYRYAQSIANQHADDTESVKFKNSPVVREWRFALSKYPRLGFLPLTCLHMRVWGQASHLFRNLNGRNRKQRSDSNTTFG